MIVEVLEPVRTDIDVAIESAGIQLADTIIDQLREYLPFEGGVARSVLMVVVGYLVNKYLTGAESWKHYLRLFIGNGCIKRGIGAVVAGYLEPAVSQIMTQLPAMMFFKK